MGKKIVLLIALCHPLLMDAQMEKQSVSSVYLEVLGYGKANLNAFSFKSNAATLGSIEKLSAGIFAEMPYRLSDLNSFRAVVVAPLAESALGIALDYFGNAIYNESSISIGYGRKTGRIQAGIGFRMEHKKVAGYGSDLILNGDLALMFHITEKFRAGWQVSNAGSILLNSKREAAPMILSAGLGYDFSNRCYMGIVLKKVEGRSVALQTGLRYQFIERVWAFAGITPISRSFYLGSGFLLKDFTLEFTVAVHPYLGSTPGLALLYNRK